MGARQDSQAFYEDPAIDVLIDRGDFSRARSIVELGCGTGRLAARLLDGVVPAEARYAGFDVSPVMRRLAAERLAPFGTRARVAPPEAGGILPVPGASADRFLATYVFDLLAPDALRAALDEAFRILEPGGRLCSVSLSPGRRFPSALVSRLWKSIWNVSPRIVGGCRPIELSASLDEDRWEPPERRTVQPWGVPSEIVVARKR
jgi:SAM-dependent methyltransferase